ncbi:unnamed protein product [Adineta ricciae]|uniref:Uncharacterized protein n=1 Tax=Adineta ricciae TaxID=249248 RepID=A0A816BSG8_ADIRI|nr:unnamed protein product [Adineta ricciae]
MMPAEKLKVFREMIFAIENISSKVREQTTLLKICADLIRMKDEWIDLLEEDRYWTFDIALISSDWFSLFKKSFYTSLEKTQQLIDDCLKRGVQADVLEDLRSELTHLVHHNTLIQMWDRLKHSRINLYKEHLLDTMRYFTLLGERRKQWMALKGSSKSLLTFSNQHSSGTGGEC